MADKSHNMVSLKGSVVIPTSDTVTKGTVTLTENINGLTTNIFFTTPNMEDTDSTLFQIVNSSGAAFVSSGTVAESITTVLGTAVGIVGGDKIVCTAEGTQSAAATIAYDIRYLT
jgi:hypothetical protein